MVIRLYTSFDLLAKYFFLRCKGNPLPVVTARFDTLVQRIGTDLTPAVYDLITFVNQVISIQTSSKSTWTSLHALNEIDDCDIVVNTLQTFALNI